MTTLTINPAPWSAGAQLPPVPRSNRWRNSFSGSPVYPEPLLRRAAAATKKIPAYVDLSRSTEGKHQ